MLNYDEHDPRFDNTFFCVEANSFAQHTIWEKLHVDLGVSWEQENPGIIATVGHIKDLPINVSIVWNRICGKRVAFYYPCSRVVDHAVIEEWIKRNVLQGKTYDDHRPSETNDSNYHHILYALRDQQSLYLQIHDKIYKWDNHYDAPNELLGLGFELIHWNGNIKTTAIITDKLRPIQMWYGPQDDPKTKESYVSKHLIQHFNEKLNYNRN